MDYTMIGDGVNLAARLESACKQYSARILISEFTRAKLKGTYRMRDVDLVVVKGKTEPVGVVEVLEDGDDEEWIFQGRREEVQDKRCCRPPHQCHCLPIGQSWWWTPTILAS